MVANILPVDPTTLGGGGGRKVKIQFLQNVGHVAYKIKGNHECSNMQAHTCVLSLHTPSTFWGEVRGQSNFFSGSSHVAYQIGEWSIEHHA